MGEMGLLVGFSPELVYIAKVLTEVVAFQLVLEFHSDHDETVLWLNLETYMMTIRYEEENMENLHLFKGWVNYLYSFSKPKNNNQNQS